MIQTASSSPSIIIKKNRWCGHVQHSQLTEDFEIFWFRKRQGMTRIDKNPPKIVSIHGGQWRVTALLTCSVWFAVTMLHSIAAILVISNHKMFNHHSQCIYYMIATPRVLLKNMHQFLGGSTTTLSCSGQMKAACGDLDKAT